MKPNFFLLDRSAQISGFRSFARVAEAELSGPAALWRCTSEHHHNPVRIHHGLFIDTQTSAIDGTGASKRCNASGAAAGDPARELDHRDRHGGLGQVDFHREPARSPARKGAGATRCDGPRAYSFIVVCTHYCAVHGESRSGGGHARIRAQRGHPRHGRLCARHGAVQPRSQRRYPHCAQSLHHQVRSGAWDSGETSQGGGSYRAGHARSD